MNNEQLLFLINGNAYYKQYIVDNWCAWYNDLYNAVNNNEPRLYNNCDEIVINDLIASTINECCEADH